MNPLLIAAGAGALWALTHGGSKTPPAGAPAADWHDAIADATASGDPKRMLALADKLDAEGYTQAAQDLRDQAASLQSAPPPSRGGTSRPARRPRPRPSSAAFTPAPISPPRKPEPPPQAPPTTSVPTPPVGAPDNGLEQALAVSKLLAQSGPWREPSSLKDLVRAFQGAHGLAVDGFYGPEMGKHIAAFGIVPPTPYYWPSSNTRTMQKAYKQFLTDKAGEDPAQADAWLAAAKRVVF